MFLGRADELDLIEHVLEYALAGHGRVLTISGPAGIGKTALLDETARRCRLHGAVVHRLRAAEFEAHVGHAVLSTLPALLRPEGTDVLEVGGSLLELLSDAARGQPQALLVDDLHWADIDSVVVLAHVARRIGDEPVFIAASCRPLPRNHPWSVVAQPSDLTLDGLDRTAAVLLLGGEAVEPAVADELFAVTGGAPLALAELGERLTPEELRGSVPLPDPLPVGPLAVAQLRESITSEADLGIVVLAVASESTAGRRLLRGVLAALELPVELLDHPDLKDLVHIEEESSEWRHPLYRAAAAELGDDDLRRRVHRAYADAFPAQAASPSVRARRAHHLDLAAVGPDQNVAAALVDAAAALAGSGALEAAGDLYAGAARRCADSDDAAGMYVTAADCLRGARERGAVPRAERMLVMAEDLAQGADTRFRVQRALALAERARGGSGDAVERLERYARSTEDSDPTRSSHARLIACHLRAELGSPDLLERVKRCARGVPTDDPLLVIGADMLLGFVEVWSGQAGGAARVLQNVDSLVLALDADVTEAGQFAQLMTVGLLFLDELELAEQLVARAMAMAERLGQNRIYRGIQNVSIELCRRRGDWRRARVMAMLQTSESSDDFNPTQGFGALLDATTGDHEMLESILVSVDPQDPRQPAIKRGLVVHAQCVAALGAGERHQAAEHARTMVSLARQTDFRHPGLWWHGDAIEALLGSGARGEAELLHAELETMVELPGLWARGAEARSAALLWPDRADTAERWRTALQVFSMIPAPFERARTLRQRARWLTSRGDLEAATEDDRAADVIFGNLGARPWIRVTADAVDRSPLDLLTPGEARVALLVAEGMTNKEIAAECFLSPRTVENHLGNAYRKLDIRTRAALAGMVAHAAVL